LLHDWMLAEIETDADRLFQNRTRNLLVALITQV